MISIILPIRNEAQSISSCLDAILAQDYQKNQIEVLVVDGMSTDKTRHIVNDYEKNNPQIHLIDNPGKIVAIGLNTAIQKSIGDIIIRVDGHTIIAPDYVSTCVETLERTKADNVGGCMYAVGSSVFGKAVALATSSPFGVGNSKFHYAQTEQDVDSVYMGAWPRDLFSSVGLFDEELIRDQDDEFNYRIRENGRRIILNPKIKSQYTTRSSPISLWKQYYQYGFWKVRVFQKHPKQMSLRHFVPSVFVLSLFISLISTFLWRWGIIFLVSCVGSYLLINTLLSLSLSIRNGWKYLIPVFISFPIIHISYGLGFIIGLFKFSNRWKDRKGSVPDWNESKANE